MKHAVHYAIFWVFPPNACTTEGPSPQLCWTTNGGRAQAGLTRTGQMPSWPDTLRVDSSAYYKTPNLLNNQTCHLPLSNSLNHPWTQPLYGQCYNLQNGYPRKCGLTSSVQSSHRTRT